jgi:hypothetical protein
MCGYVACVPECCGSVCYASQLFYVLLPQYGSRPLKHVLIVYFYIHFVCVDCF